MRPFLAQQQKAPVLHDQLLPFRPQRRRPANILIPILQGITGRPPRQQSHPFPVQDRHLAQKIADRTRLAQVMILAQQAIKSLPILGRNHFDSQGVPVAGSVPTTPLASRCVVFIDPTTAKTRPVVYP